VKYLVTGATGFIGGRVVDQLLAAGHQVHALVRSAAKAPALARPGVTLFEGDITERASLRPATTGVDGVFHLAAWYKVGPRDKSPAERVNVEGTRHVLETMRDLGIPKGVYTSTLAVFSDTKGQLVDETYRHDGPWLSEYDRTKWVAHYEVAEPLMRSGLPLVIVQPGLNYGPGDTSMVRDTLVQYLQSKLPMLPEGSAYCWGHVEDTARGHLLAMDKGRVAESYIIAGPPHTFVEALTLAERITGIPAPKRRAGPGMLRAMAGIMRVVEKVVPVPAAYASETLRVLAGTTYLGSSAKAERELGFSARSLEVGLRETLLHEMKLLGMPLPGEASAALHSGPM
jgi:nucleoside-diphosphate-sugar epimerase